MEEGLRRSVNSDFILRTNHKPERWDSQSSLWFHLLHLKSVTTNGFVVSSLWKVYSIRFRPPTLNRPQAGPRGVQVEIQQELSGLLTARCRQVRGRAKPSLWSPWCQRCRSSGMPDSGGVGPAVSAPLPAQHLQMCCSVPVCAPALSARPLRHTQDRRLSHSPWDLANLHLRYEASGSRHENASLLY